MIAAAICAQILATSINVSCVEAIAIAKLESNLNPSAVGALGEVGLFQVRPQYFKTSWQLDQQIRLGIEALGTIKARCVRDLGQNWVSCWNIGVSGALRRKGRKPGPYVLKYIKLVQETKQQLRRQYENLPRYSANF
jgi:hypothetical protein